MSKDEANREAKKIFEQWTKDREQIELEAKKNGTWQDVGLDSNNHLFKKLDAETKEKLKELNKKIDKQ